MIVNIPFGYQRGAQSYWRQWFFAIHLPVPFVIAIRIASGLGWQFSTFPVMIRPLLLLQQLLNMMA